MDFSCVLIVFYNKAPVFNWTTCCKVTAILPCQTWLPVAILDFWEMGTKFFIVRSAIPKKPTSEPNIIIS